MTDMPPPRIALTVLSGPDQGRRLETSAPEIRLGRHASNDLAFPDDTTVSQRHATLRWQAPHWLLQDLGSKNGTFVEAGDARQPVKGPVPIAPSQLFYLGSAQIAYSSADARRAEPPPGPPPALLRASRDGDSVWFQLPGATALAERYPAPARFSELDAHRERIEHLVASAHLDVAADIGAGLVQAGKTLAERLIPPEIGEHLAAVADQALLLELDPALLGLPWELLAPGGAPLCLVRAVVRRIVLDAPARRSRPEAVAGRTMLIVANPTEDLPDAQEASEALLEQMLMTPGMHDVRLLAGKRATRRALLELLPNTGVVYYIGHADHKPERPEESAWLLHGDRLTASDFAALPSPPGFVFANACESGRETPGSGGFVLPSHGLGTGTSLLLAGVRHYLGAAWRIPAVSSSAFAAVLFERLVQGGPLGAAVCAARRAVWEDFGGANPAWAAYLQYGDPAWRLPSAPSE